MIYGGDFSHWNRSASVPWDDFDFAYVKVSDGVGSDLTAEAHFTRGVERGAVLGAYHFEEFGIHAPTASAQALRFTSRVAVLEGSFGPLFLVVDCEPRDWKHLEAPARVAAMLFEFVTEVEQRLGRVCGIYIPGAYAPMLPLAPELGTRPLLLADYTAPYVVPAPWSMWTILQYGVRGVDRDQFDGTREELRACFGIGDDVTPRGDTFPGPL